MIRYIIDASNRNRDVKRLSLRREEWCVPEVTERATKRMRYWYICPRITSSWATILCRKREGERDREVSHALQCINVVCQVEKHMINEEVMACHLHSEGVSISSCVDWPSSSSLVNITQS